MNFPVKHKDKYDNIFYLLNSTPYEIIKVFETSYRK